MIILGRGNHGVASLMADGRVQKCTNDRREYDAACLLVGKDVQGVVKVYDCSQCSDEEGNARFIIVEERLLMTTRGIGIKNKNRFIKCFKLSWCDYFETLTYKDRLPCANYIDFLFLCVREQHQEHCDDAFAFFRKRTRSALLTAMYHATCRTIAELYRQCPDVEIDLNGGNFGFTEDGQMKFFDLLHKC